MKIKHIYLVVLGFILIPLACSKSFLDQQRQQASRRSTEKTFSKSNPIASSLDSESSLLTILLPLVGFLIYAQGLWPQN